MDKVDELLLELKRVLSIIDDSYIIKIKCILDGDSEYDKLFYHYVDRLGLDNNTAKRLCIDKIEKVTRFIHTNNKLKDYYRIKKINNKDSNFTDLYYIIDDNLQNYYDDIDELQELIINKSEVINGLNAIYDINVLEEILYIKLYLSGIVYEYMNSYIDVVDCDDYYIDEDTRYINIYNILGQINDVSDVIDIFDNYIYEIIDIYYMYLKLDKHGKDLIHLKIIKNNKMNELIKICPFCITMFKRYYNLYYNNEELKSIEIGKLTLRIVEDMIKEAYNGTYSFHNIIKNTLKIIKSSSMNYDVDKWLKYLSANVYENIIIKKIKDREELLFLNTVNNNLINDIIHQQSLQEYVIKKFYEFNNEVYDVLSLKYLRNNESNTDKVMIKRINPFYDDIEK